MENVISSHLHQYKNITRFPIYSYDFIDTPNIDADFQKIGREVVKSIDLKSLKGFDENSVTFITTIVSIYGGGTRMIEDWTGFYQSMGMKCSIIITSKEGSDKSAIEKFVNKGVDCLFVESTGSAVSNIKSFQEILADLRPKTAFLCSFAMDYVAIAGIQDALVDKLYLNLVLDHGLSTGLHLPQITKIITYRPYLAHLMKDYIKIDGDKIIYIPLSKKDTNSLDINARKYLENGYILSASSTSYQYKISDSYIYIDISM